MTIDFEFPGNDPNPDRRRRAMLLRVIAALLLLGIGLLALATLRAAEDGPIRGWAAPLIAPAEQARAETGSMLTEVGLAYAAARSVNAVVSVLMSGQVSAGVGIGGSIGVGQVLDPVDDLIERFSSIALTCLLGLGILRLLLDLGADLALPALIGPGALILAMALVTPVGPIQARLAALGRILLATGLFLLLGLPALIVISEAMAGRYLADSAVQAQAALEAMGRLGSEFDPTEISAMPERLEQLTAAAQTVIGHVIDLTLAFVIRVFVLPIALTLLITRLMMAALRPGRWRAS